MRKIAVEEHFVSPRFAAGAGREYMDYHRGRPPRGPQLIKQLEEVGEQRIAEMDAAGIDMQVLSLHTPGVEQLGPEEAIETAREANEFLADVVKRNPARFAGLAALPTSAPEDAARELERLVTRQNFKGAIINGHTRGRYLDDPFFWPMLECAAALEVPIYLHPAVPPKAVVDASYGGLPGSMTFLLSANAWGWHIETATHLLRAIVAGVFDKFPNLQIVIGHLGETLPFMLPRFDRNLPMNVTRLQRPVSDYLRQNVNYTLGGFNFPAAFLNLLLEIGVDRIMFSVDYPYGSMKEAVGFLENIPVGAADREKIAHGNAERLFRL